MKHFLSLFLLALWPPLIFTQAAITGELRQWHNVTITWAGPATSEAATTNPFLNCRLDVTFTNGADTLQVPGYFAADGNAAQTGATAGNQWRVHFRPPLTGTWSYTATMITGTNAALTGTGSPVALAGAAGSLVIQPTNKQAPDFRALGRLQYVGLRYRQFQGTGQYFFNVGADSPENLLAYWEFDQTANDGGANNDLNGTTTYYPGFAYAGDGLHHFAAHVQDWQPGDPTWHTGKGKGIIGALNYLASQGLNAYSALLWNVGGDGDDTWPFITDNNLDRFDCSKLDQWGLVFTHAEETGLLFHAKLFETENDQDMTTAQWQLYFREMIARYGHYLAWEWNLGEENTMPAAHITAQAQYLRSLTSYPLHVVLHTYPANNWRQSQWGPQLGERSTLSGISIQSGPNDLPNIVTDWLQQSEAMGHIWTANHDEQGSASAGVSPDPGYPGNTTNNHTEQRRGAWKGAIRGMEGHKSYFGYNLPHNDLDLEDYRSRASWWTYLARLRQIVNLVPFQQMDYAPGLDQTSNDNFVLTDGTDNWLIYAQDGDNINIPMPAGVYEVTHYRVTDSLEVYGGTFNPASNGGMAQLSNGYTGGEWATVVKRVTVFPLRRLEVTVQGSQICWSAPEAKTVYVDLLIPEIQDWQKAVRYHTQEGCYDVRGCGPKIARVRAEDDDTELISDAQLIEAKPFTNMASGILTVSCVIGEPFTVTDTAGRKVMQGYIQRDSIDLTGLPPGFYTVTISTHSYSVIR